MITIRETPRPLVLLTMACLVLSGLFASGCTSIKAFPIVARAGDTVALGVGSPIEMKRQAGTMVTYTSDGDPFNPIDLTPNLRAVFKIYPDKTSPAWLNNTFTEILSDHSGHGPWQQVMAIDLPTTMPLGTGKIQVTTGSGQYSGQPHVNDYQIDLEILSGSPGAANTFDHPVVPGSLNTVTQLMTNLEPIKQVSVRPPRFPSMSSTYGAIEFVLDFPVTTDDGDGDGFVDPVQVYVVRDDYGSRDLNSQIQVMWESNANITRVMMVAPNGMSVKQTRFSIVGATKSPMNTVTTLDNSIPPVITSVTYYDLNGNVTTVAPADTEFLVKLAYDF